MYFARISVIFALLVAPALSGDRKYEIELIETDANIDSDVGDVYLECEDEDGIMRMSGYLRIKKTIPCEVQLGMSAKLKENNMWAQNFQSFPKTYPAFMKENGEVVDMLLSYANMTKECPLEEGYYVFKDFVVDSSKFPDDLKLGLYKLNIAVELGNDLIFSVEITADAVSTAGDSKRK